MPSTAPLLTCISLYSGAGGLDLGFLRAGIVPIWANDIDPIAVETYRRAVGPHAFAGDIRAQALPARGSADLVIGGPPCQGFSVAGKMDPNDPRSDHVWTFLDVVRHIDPAAFVLENVKNLAINVRWAGVRDRMHAIASAIGYSTSLFLLNAAHYGVPQARERMFLVGVKDAHRGVSPPCRRSIGPSPTLRQLLGVLPPYGTPGNDTLCVARVTAAKKPVLRRSPFAGMLFNGHGRPADLDAPALTLPASMGGNRTPIVDQVQIESGGRSWVVEYHRHLCEGGAPLRDVPARLRRLTVQEAAAIQTFPAGMKFAGSVTAQFRQIGNAVPPEMAYRVALAVRRVVSAGQAEPDADPSVDDVGGHEGSAIRPSDNAPGHQLRRQRGRQALAQPGVPHKLALECDLGL
jgi:DNA (cytosine-5)-methyltransferase 1